ncbi:MAG: cytochrome c1, partial [Candidatus Saccharimonas sp.]|nr:cytochrome c1 [Planctomycetaceae bacterium]
VGYPDKVNLAWDANDMRLALVWHGAFIDASRHWNGRGQGFEAPLGDHLIELAPNAPLAKLASPNDPWPTTLARESGFRFLGYKLDAKQQPTFRYSFSGVTVEDQPTPLKADGQPFASLRRTLTVAGSATEPLYYRAAVASKIEKLAEGEYKLDGFWTMKLNATNNNGGEAATLRQAGGKWELLVPVNLSGGKAVLTQDYMW